MPERLSDKLRAYLLLSQGRDVDIKDIRSFMKIEPGSNDDDNLRKLMSHNLVLEKILSPSGKGDGRYKVITQVKPVAVFGRERRPPIRLNFPRCFDSMLEIPFAEDIVVREGDLILIAGVSNFGKTALCLNILAENLDSNPVLMGNEYTTVDNEPSSRFLSRLDNMDWVQWDNEGHDRFTLLPVREDFAEHIIKDRINIIDWINLDEAYLISGVMERIKRAVGKGIVIVVIQKGEGTDYGRGKQYTKDFTDVEILLDPFGKDEIRMSLGKVKESRRRLYKQHYAFRLEKGVRLMGFREIKECPLCSGSGKYRGGDCDTCQGKGMIDA